MGCGDDILNVATGGISGAVSTGDIIGSATGALTGGVSSMTGGSISDPLYLIGGDVRKLMDATSDSILSAGVTNIIAASKYKNLANQMDVMMDPSRVNDKWIRESGEWLEYLPAGHAVREVAPMVGAIVGGVFAGPAGSAGGYYFGNKIKGGSNEAGAIGAGLSFAGGVIGAAAQPAAGALTSQLVSQGLSQGVSNAVAQGVVQGAVGAGMGAATGAATGQDIGQSAMYGGLSGLAGGVVGSQVAPATKYLQSQGVNPTVANALTRGVAGLTTGATGAALRGQDVGYASMLGGAGGTVGGATTGFTGSKDAGTLASALANQGLRLATSDSPTVRNTLSQNVLQRAASTPAINTVARTIVPETLAPITRSVIDNRLQQALARRSGLVPSTTQGV